MAAAKRTQKTTLNLLMFLKDNLSNKCNKSPLMLISFEVDIRLYSLPFGPSRYLLVQRQQAQAIKERSVTNNRNNKA